jgi:tight adherence protein B
MNETVLPLLAAVLAGGAVLALALGFMHERDDTDVIADRLRGYGPSHEEQTTASGEPRSPRALLDVLNNMVAPLLARSSATGRLAENLQRADLRMRASEWLLAVAGIGALVGFLLALRFGNVIFFPAGVVVTWFLSGFFLRYLQARRAGAFDRQLGETILLLSNALKAGLSFAQALSTVAKNASPPISDEFARATREIQLGIPVDDAMTHMVDRNRSEDFDLLVTAVQIQRVVGGNLAEILDTIAFTIRERVRIKGEIRTLTAQARASGYIITILPIALAGILSIVSPSYFRPMFSETLGIIMLSGAAFSMMVGYAIIQKIVKIEV